MSVTSAAIEEAYAAVEISGDLFETIEIDHPSFPDGPLRFVRGTPIRDVYETESLPVGASFVPFTVVDFDFTLPGHEEGGPTRARIRIDNVSRVIRGALRAAIAADHPFTVTVRIYSSNDPANPEVYDGLKMGAVDVNALSASGELHYEEIELKAFPGVTYDMATYPALYGQ